MKYLCSKCSNQLTKFEIELNTLYPVRKFFCEICQKKHEKEIINKLSKSIADCLDIYDYKKK